MFGFNRIIAEDNTKVKSVISSQNSIEKNKAESFAVALYRMRNEKDPIIRTKMNIRLSKGIYDFSDL